MGKMEAWQQEEMRQLRLTRKQQLLPRCQCCEKRITTEYCLDLLPFGLAAKLCERCVDRNLVRTEANGGREDGK